MTNQTSTLSVLVHAVIFGIILYAANLYYDKKEGFNLGLGSFTGGLDISSPAGTKVILLFVGWLFFLFTTLGNRIFFPDITRANQVSSSDDTMKIVGYIFIFIGFTTGVIGAAL